MQKLRSQGLFEKIGCSLYDPQQIFLLQQRYALELVLSTVPQAPGVADMQDAIRLQVAASIAVKQKLLVSDAVLRQVERLAADCLLALKAGGKVIFTGNGGSFADAQHLSTEFTSRFMLHA